MTTERAMTASDVYELRAEFRRMQKLHRALDDPAQVQYEVWNDVAAGVLRRAGFNFTGFDLLAAVKIVNTYRTKDALALWAENFSGGAKQ